MTNSELIRRALLLAQVVAEGIPLSAEQASDGLSSLNEMLADWKESGIDLGYYPQTSVSADLPLYDDAVRAVRYNLAVSLAAEYERTASPDVYRIADET